MPNTCPAAFEASLAEVFALYFPEGFYTPSSFEDEMEELRRKN